MHLLAMRRDVYEAHPFIASSLFDAMCESKERARLRIRDLGTLNYMLPWMTADIDELDEVFDGDPWPYGIEPNRPTLEAAMKYLTEQGVIKAPMPIEDMFVPTHGRYDGKTGKRA
jgi:4,5-dihydroxyphthalate decarboxylase